MMNKKILYPLLIEPQFQYRLWGGKRLAEVLNSSLTIDGPVGEAWILSDRDDFMSCIANGPLKGKTIGQLIKDYPEQLLGSQAGRYRRFPLLLKFLDAHEMLSVQVHPSDEHKDLLPKGERGKTEAWVVIEAGKDCRIYAGLKPGTTAGNLRAALKDNSVANYLPYFTPKPGDGILIPAGTVHTLGGDVVVFEVQQNSDVTFRLYDWDHTDPKTGSARPLQIDEAIKSINFSQGTIIPVAPLVEESEPVLRERLFDCEFFKLWRLTTDSLFHAGTQGEPRILVCISGEGDIESDGTNYSISMGNVVLMPAETGRCSLMPRGNVTLLEIALPE
jgi:mannose-6-phosphate isomerase